MRVGTDLELIGDCAFFASCPVNDLNAFLTFLPQCEFGLDVSIRSKRNFVDNVEKMYIMMYINGLPS